VGETVILKDGKANLTDLLSTINSKNISSKNGDLPFEYNSKKQTYEIKAIQEGDRKGIFPGSGTDRQYILTDLGADGFVFKNQMGKEAVAFYAEPSQNVQTTPDSLEKRKSIKKEARNQIYCTLVTYLIKNTLPNGGNPTAIEKVDKVIKIVKGGEENLSIDIQDDGTLFERAKSVLLEDGKSNISNAILNQFTSVSSIEVVGGASKEGDAAFNKKLCQDRAKSVEAYLKTITSAAITVSSEANIQPLESTDDLKTWRKVTLKVTGNRVAQTSPKEEISYVARKKQFKPDAVILAQVSFEFKIEVDEA
jgi:outer membrane protein OmpA-like peptidoglycan-associated protein